MLCFALIVKFKKKKLRFGGGVMVSSSPLSNEKRKGMRIEKTRRVLLGIGFWVQGLRCLPWLGINFFLKDGLKLDPSTLQILQNSANLPMVAKPFYGIISDSNYIFGQHRIPYIAFGAFLQAVSWIAVALISPTSLSFFTMIVYLLLGNLGASIVEVANDAIVAETGKASSPASSSSSGELQSFVWMASSIGGVLGNLIAGVAIDKFSAQELFLLFGVVLAFQFFITITIHESSLDLPKSPSNIGIRKQLSDLACALTKPEIFWSIIWFAASYGLVPALTGTMFFYQTQHLKIESSILGMSKVFGQAAMLLWGVAYNQRFKSILPRKLISAIQAALAVLMISDALFVKGLFKNMGIPESLYVMTISGVLEVLHFFKILPFSVLMAQLCPPGCEGSVMAFLMAVVALALIVSGYLGVALASYVGVTGDDFSSFPVALLIQAGCTALPLCWSSWIPDYRTAETKKKKN